MMTKLRTIDDHPERTAFVCFSGRSTQTWKAVGGGRREAAVLGIEVNGHANLVRRHFAKKHAVFDDHVFHPSTRVRGSVKSR